MSGDGGRRGALKAAWSRQSAARRGVVSIAGGTATGQVLAALVSPILARVYSPAHFGTFAVVSATAMILSPAMALRLELAVPLPKADDRARTLVIAGLAFGLTISGVLMIVTLLVRSTVASGLSMPDLETWLLVGPVMAMVFAAYRVLNQWALRQRRYVAIGRRGLYSSVAIVIAQLGLAGLGMGAGGLILGLVTGQLLGVLSLLSGSELGGRWPARNSVSEALRRYRRFPIMMAPSGILNAAGTYAPTIVIGAAFGATATGLFGLTQRVLATPMTLLGQSVAQVYLGEVSQSRRGGDGRAFRLFQVASKRLALVAAVMVSSLLVLGPVAFPLVFGERWRTSGRLAQALALSLGVQLVAATLSQTLVVYERLRMQLMWDATRVVAVTASMIVTVALGGSLLACVWVFSLTSTALYGVLWLACHHVASNEPRGLDPSM